MDDSTSVAIAVLVIGVFGLAACTLAMSQLLPRAQRRRWMLLDWFPFARRSSSSSRSSTRPTASSSARSSARSSGRSGTTSSGGVSRAADAEARRANGRVPSSATDTGLPGTAARRARVPSSPAARRAASARSPIAGVPARARIDVGGAASPVRPSRQPAMRPDVLRRERERIDAAATRRFIDQMADEHPEVLAEVVGELLARDRTADGPRTEAP